MMSVTEVCSISVWSRRAGFLADTLAAMSGLLDVALHCPARADPAETSCKCPAGDCRPGASLVVRRRARAARCRTQVLHPARGQLAQTGHKTGMTFAGDRRVVQTSPSSHALSIPVAVSRTATPLWAVAVVAAC